MTRSSPTRGTGRNGSGKGSSVLAAPAPAARSGAAVLQAGQQFGHRLAPVGRVVVGGAVPLGRSRVPAAARAGRAARAGCRRSRIPRRCARVAGGGADGIHCAGAGGGEEPVGSTGLLDIADLVAAELEVGGAMLERPGWAPVNNGSSGTSMIGLSAVSSVSEWAGALGRGRMTKMSSTSSVSVIRVLDTRPGGGASGYPCRPDQPTERGSGGAVVFDGRPGATDRRRTGSQVGAQGGQLRRRGHLLPFVSARASCASSRQVGPTFSSYSRRAEISRSSCRL